MKAYLCAAGLFLAVGLIGCKPKTTTATGQVFIVTRGAENVKLGAVEILLVDKAQVIKFLNTTKPAVQSAIVARQQELVLAKEEAKKAQAVVDWLLTNNRPATNASYLEVRSQIQELQSQVESLQQQFDAIEVQRAAASSRGNSARADALLAQENANLEKQRWSNSEASRLLAKLDEIARLETAQASKKLKSAKSRIVTAEAELANSPKPEDYFANFTPAVLNKTLSDADGKFSLTYPRDKPGTIFACARREMLDKTEVYYWLVNAPSSAEAVQLFLSNNNLVFVDPDGYFELKPKRP